MKEKFDPFFVPDILEKLAMEFVQYENSGKWYTPNEIRQIGEVITNLKTIANRHGCELSRLIWNDRAHKENSVRYLNNNVIVFPKKSPDPTNDGAA